MNTFDINDLRTAKKILENPGFAIKVANYIGRPAEYIIEKVDSKTLNNVTSKALRKALNISIYSLNNGTVKPPSNITHKFLVAGSGGIGGFFGISALAIELPLSTTIMLRSIADVARSQGHNLNRIDTQLACLEVFSLGSTKNSSDDAGESAYFTSRATLAYEMKLALDAVQGMSVKAIQNALSKGQMPLLVKLINTIASRFGITVTEKLAAQAVPVVGSVGGASINLMFMDHFQNMAQGHFIVKRLENVYGIEVVRDYYEKIIID